MNSQVLVRSFASRERRISHRRVYWQEQDGREKEESLSEDFLYLSYLFIFLLYMYGMLLLFIFKPSFKTD